MYPRDRGTRTLVRSSFAGKADIRKRFFWQAKLLQDRDFEVICCDWSALADDFRTLLVEGSLEIGSLDTFALVSP